MRAHAVHVQAGGGRIAVGALEAFGVGECGDRSGGIGGIDGARHDPGLDFLGKPCRAPAMSSVVQAAVSAGGGGASSVAVSAALQSAIARSQSSCAGIWALKQAMRSSALTTPSHNWAILASSQAVSPA